MDSPPPSSASRPAGYAAIALASAAGVIAASRMGRPALVLAAGLALAWWRKHQLARQPAAPEAPPVNKPAPVVAETPVVQEIAPDLEEEGMPAAPLTPPPAYGPQAQGFEIPFTPEPAPSQAALTFEPPASTEAALVFETPLPLASEPDGTFEPPQPLSPPTTELEPPPQVPSWLPEVAGEATPPLVIHEAEPEAPTLEIEPAPPISFPIAPVRNEAPLTDAWNDLRAALNPSLLGKVPKICDPLPPLPATDEAPPPTLPRIEAPEMPEMYIFPPSSPLLDTLDEDEPLPTFPAATDEAPTVTQTQLNVPVMPEMSIFPASSPLITESDEGVPQPHHPPPPGTDSLHYFPQPSSEPVGEIPDEVHLPGMTDEEASAAMAGSGFLVTDPPVATEPTMPQLVHGFAPPAIVSKLDPARAAAVKAAESPTPPAESGRPLTAPIVVPREAQVKKSFFDWLRS